jgi:hypothetical protein
MDGIRIGGLQDATLDLQQAEIDTTDKDSAGWDEFIPGQKSLTLNGTCVYEEDDLGQDAFIDAILNGTQHEFLLRPWGASAGADEWIMYGFPTSTQLDSPNKEALSLPFTIRLSQQPIRQNQSLFAGTFQLLMSESGAEQLPSTMLINSVTNTAKWAYRGGDAGSAIWPAHVGPADLSRAVVAGGALFTVDQPAPFTDHTRGVVLLGGNYFTGGDRNEYEWGGSGGAEDFVLEVVLRVDDLTDAGQILGKSDGAGGWCVNVVSNRLRLRVFNTAGAANVTIDSGTLEQGTWYHIIYFLDQSGSGVCYTNATAGTPASLATVSGAADVTALEFAIGNEDSGTAGTGGQATVAWAAGWGSAGWLDTHLQAALASERLAYLAGVMPDSASGTTKAPTTMTRTSAAFLHVREPIGERILGHKVGPNWPRICSWGATWGSPVGTPYSGLLLESAATNTLRETDDFTGGSWTATRISAALVTMSAPLHLQEVYALTSDTTDANSHYIGETLGAIGGHAVVSVFAKRKNGLNNGSNWILLSADDAADTADGTFFDIQNGVVGTSGANVANSYIEDWGNGWFRCVLRINTSSSGFSIALAEADNDIVITSAPDGDANCYVTCPVREGRGGVEYASSYVRNTSAGADASRNGDAMIFKMDDGNMTTPQTAFTIDYACVFAGPVVGGAPIQSPRIFTLNDGGSGSDQIRVRGRPTPYVSWVDVVSTEGANGSIFCGSTGVYDGIPREYRIRLATGTSLVHENTTEAESNSATMASASPNDIDRLNLVEDGFNHVLLQKIEIYASDLGASF